MKCPPAPIITSVMLDEPADSIAIYVSEKGTNTGTLKILVNVKTLNGKYAVGKTTTRAANLHTQTPSRLVAVAQCPGAQKWDVQVLGSNVNTDAPAEVELTASETPVGQPGLVVLDGGTLDAL